MCYRRILPFIVLLVVGACTDAPELVVGETEGPHLLTLSPEFVASASAEPPINSIRVVVRPAVGGEVLGETIIGVDPEAESWDVQISFEVTDGRDEVVLTLELLSSSLAGEEVVWSGRVGPVSLANVEIQKRVFRVPLGRGPLENLDIRSLEIVDLPSSLVVGGEAVLEVETAGGPPQPVVFWSVSDASVLEVVADRLIAVGEGTAEVEAAVGRLRASATVEVVAAPPNEPPVVEGARVATDEDVALVVSLEGADPEGEPLSFQIVEEPTSGSLGVLLPGGPSSVSVVYTPQSGFVGEDRFTFTASDGELSAEPAAIEIVVRSVDDEQNNAPFAFPASAVTTVGAELVLTLSGSDPDGDGLSFQISTPPAFGDLGTVVRAGPRSARVSYRPGDQFLGSDEFYFRVSDGQAESAVARVDVAVLAPAAQNRKPIAEATSMTTETDAPVDVLLAGTDADGDELIFTVTSPPSSGSLGSIDVLDRTGAIVRYVPDAGFSGVDEFGFIVSDGAADSEEAFVRVTVDPPPNGGPTAIGIEVGTDEETPRLILLEATDPDGDALTFRVAGGPVVGDLGPIVALDDARAQVVYTPPQDFSGQDRFTFTAFDGQLTSPPAAVDVNVREVVDEGEGNRAPRARTVDLVTFRDRPVTVPLGGEDPDGDDLRFVIEAPPSHGTLGTIEFVDSRSSRVVYTPDEGYVGNDSFQFSASDGSLSSPATDALIRVEAPANNAPTAEGRTVTVTEATATAIILTGSDPDADPLTFTVVDGPTSGILSAGEAVDGSTFRITYTPNGGFTGEDGFTFTVSDGDLVSAPAEVAISVEEAPEENVAPQALPASVTTTRGQSVTVTLSATDANGDALTFAIDGAPTHGSLGEVTPIDDVTARVVYTPDEGFDGADSFAFTVFDGELTSEPGQVTVTVAPPPNTPPVAIGGSTETEAGEPVTVLLQGADEDGDALDFSVAEAPTGGTLSALTPLGPISAEVVYTPDEGFEGEDTFTFIVSDGEAESSPAVIGVTVLRSNAPPVADPLSVSVLRDTAREITLTGSDADGDALDFEIVTGPTAGSLGGVVSTGPTTAVVTYSPDGGFTGTDAFTYRASDGVAQSSAVTVELDVRAGNGTPTAISQTVGTSKNQPLTLLLEGTDPDGDFLSFEITGGPSNGSLGPLTRVSDQSMEVVYTPSTGFDGDDVFTFRVDDGVASSADATVDVTVSTPNSLVFVVPDPALIDAIDGTLEVSVYVIGPQGDRSAPANSRYTSTDESVFTVQKTSDTTAVLTAVGNGEADVLVKVASTTKSARVTVQQQVTQVELLHEGSEARLAVGGTMQFTAVPKDRNGFAVAGRTATWESTDANVLSVEADTDLIGIGTAHSEGTVTVTVTVDGVTATLEVVIDP